MPWPPDTLVVCRALAANLNSYRYFQSSGYDVYLKRKAKGRADKVPLTVGMLYRAIKALNRDTEALEGV